MKKLIVLGVVALVAFCTVMYAISVYTNTRNEGNKIELTLTAEYKGMMAEYGQFRTSFIDQLGIAREKSGAMDKILTDAISGRYNKPGSPEVDSGKMFSAVSEAYPDLKGLDIFDKIADFVKTGREKFAQRQEKLANSVKDYQVWRTTGSFLHPIFASWIGFPSKNIEIKIGDKMYRGQEALDKMGTVIISAESNQIFDSGVDTPLNNK